jgi:O-antigen/teichoic acid export membrane protein
MVSGKIMKNERAKNAKRNIIWGTISKIVMLLIPFIVRTIMLKTLGEQYLGLNSLFISILQVLSLTDLGFSSAIVYNMYKPIVEDDGALICALLNLYRKFYRIVGSVIGVIGLCLLPFLDKLISGGYPREINIYVLYLISLAGTVVSYFMFAYKTALLTAHQRNDVNSNITTVSYILLYIGEIIVLLTTRNYYVYIFLSVISAAIQNILTGIITKRMYPQYVCKGLLPKKNILELKKQVGALIGHKVGYVVLNSTDNIVISAFIGLSTVAMYGNYYYIYSAVGGFLNIAYYAILAGIGSSMVQENVETNHKQFKLFTLINQWVISWCAVCLISLYQPFMKIWVGEKLMFPMSTVILLVFYFYLGYARRIVNNYKEAGGIWLADVAKPYAEAGVNLITNIVLVQFIGINGVILSSIIAMGLVALPWETHVLFKSYFIKGEKMYYVMIAKSTIIAIITCASTYMICSFVPNIGIVWFLAKFAICIIVPNIIMVIFYWNNPIFKDCINILKKSRK